MQIAGLDDIDNRIIDLLLKTAERPIRRSEQP